MRRRTFIATTAALSATSLAGCGGSSTTDQSTADDTATDSGTTSSGDSASLGSFRLLISDQPAAIGDFDSLDVTFDTARVFRAGSDADEEETETATDTSTESETETEETDTETETTTDTSTEEATETEETETTTDTETESMDAASGGYETFDLDGATVDLTEVVGDRAIGVLDGELETGTYTKVELNVASVEGVVDGAEADVKVPSNKLMITKNFEVAADSTVEFVFDINVVKKGNQGYNLLPVISESGVAGEDVEVEEVEADATDTETETDAETTTTTEA